MTNFQRWQLLCRDITSPQSFIDWGWYYIIAAALQRRVWNGPKHMPLFPNIYVFLVAKPGIGKGKVIKPVTEILKHFKLPDPNKANESSKPESYKGQEVKDIDPVILEALEHSNYSIATSSNPSKKILEDRPLTIPVAADSTTYQALLVAFAKATRRINYKEFDEKLQKKVLKIYTHASLAFSLEEISSLLAKNTDDVVNCLIKTYDCGDYDKETKTQGCDRVRNCCLNILGGTTPSFMQSTFDNKLIGDGFTSRTHFIFEHQNRFNTLKLPERTEEQKIALNEILVHVEKLTKLYGQLSFTEEAMDYLEHWWTKINPVSKPNTSLKLEPYYSRKDIHTKKLAMILHCSEDAEHEEGVPKNKMTLDTVKKALDILAGVEKNMHYAINFDGKNPLSSVAKKIVNYVTSAGPQGFNDLRLEFYDDARESEMVEVVNHLLVMGKLIKQKKDLPDGKQVDVLDVVRQSVVNNNLIG